MAALSFLLRILTWITNMQLLFSSLRNFAVVNVNYIFSTFTLKQIMLRITWLILTILLFINCIYLILLIRVCPTSYITIL
ncbi:hypothetical protein LINGRAHAP2_LOCUS2644 [Linum grandiflorum]